MSKFSKVFFLFCGVLAFGVCTQLALGDDKTMELPKPSAEHALLKNFVGEWDCEMESLDPKNPVKHKSTMSGKMIGEFWANVTFKGEMMGMPFTGQGTFGFDAKKKRAIGQWVDSTGDHQWVYEGKIDGKKLILNAKGPSMVDPSKMCDFRDTWDISTPDKLILTSEFSDDAGKWTMMMKAVCMKRK